MFRGPGANPVTAQKGVRVSLASGATASTDINVSGLGKEDRLIAVIGFDPDNVTESDQVKDFTTDFAVSGSGTIASASADTSGYKLLVVWENV